MKVKDVEISEETIEKALASFPTGREFTLAELRNELAQLGVPAHNGITDRAGDRILQRARRLGTHVYSGGKWSRRG